MSKLRNIIEVIRAEKNWGLDFLDKFGMINNKYILFKLRNGINILVRSKTFDRNAVREIFIHKTYTPKGFELGIGDTVIDIGAHIGTFSLFAITQFAQEVYSFEPVSENYELLDYNIWRNSERFKKYSQVVTVEHKAVSNKTGKRRMGTTSWNTGGHSFYQEGDSSELVETTTLDSIVRKYGLPRIDFLKMDCEGAEFEILFNAPDRILKKIGKISMECHGITKENTIHSMADFLIRKGFTVRCVMNDASTPSGMLYAKR